MKKYFLIIFCSVFIIQYSQAQKKEDLFKAAFEGDIEKVENLLDKGLRIDSRSKSGDSPLTIAASEGHFDLVEFLLDEGANINVENKKGYNALLYAIDFNDTNAVNVLIKNGADVNARTFIGYSPLMHAVDIGNYSMTKHLLENKAKVNVYDIVHGQTPLMIAVIWGYKDIVELLLNNDALVNANEIHGWTPLMYACDSNRFEIAKLLVDHGAMIDDYDRNYRDAIMHVPLWGDFEIIKMFVGFGDHAPAKFDLSSYTGYSALVHAIKRNESDVAKYILSSRTNNDNDLRAALILCAASNELETTKYIFENYDVNVDSRTKNGETLLMIAVKSGHYKMAEYFIENDADVNAIDGFRHCPMTLAAINGQKEMIELLLKSGADVNSKDDVARDYFQINEFGTALMHAASRGYTDIVKVLLKNGASTELKNRMGMDVLIVSVITNQYKSVKILFELGKVNPNSFDNDGLTPLMHAATKGHSDIIELLVENGAYLNMINRKNGATALDYADIGLSIYKDLKEDDKIAEFEKVINLLESKDAKRGDELNKRR
jgi:ankyrin repeat protein